MTESPVLPSDLHAALERGEAQCRALGVRFCALSLPAPSGVAPRLLESRITDFSCYWADWSREESAHAGDVMVGVGAAIRHRLAGADRFEKARELISKSYDELHVPDHLQPFVRFFGGGAFNPGRDGSGSCWEGFGDASFFLPRVTYVQSGEAARLIVLVESGQLDQTIDLVRRVSDAFSRELVPSRAALFATRRVGSTDEATWKSLLQGIQACIAQGAAEKIVAARRVTFELSRAPELAEILSRLSSLAPQCTHFALRLGSKTFVGATPELLVEKRAEVLHTEALAGSISSSLEDAGRLLLQSQKDRHEHTFVVDAIVDQLAPICTSLEVPKQPEIRRLARILHLRTPIFATLCAPYHVLSLVSRLHPTPAVGGVPREIATRFIADHEVAERGWYAAPFGWVERSGDGKFVVTLRSALLNGNKVHAYAGAGIVAQSNASSEFAETELKLSSMLGALGVGS